MIVWPVTVTYVTIMYDFFLNWQFITWSMGADYDSYFVKNTRSELNFSYFFFLFCLNLFFFILFLELGLGLEWQYHAVTQ